MERGTQKEVVLRKDVFGSFSGEEFTDDRVVDVIAWLQGVLDGVPKEYKSDLRIDVDSVGGYEGEHHTEVEIYYMRPETDQEMSHRIDSAKRRAEDDLRRHQQYAEEAARRLQSLG